MKRIVCVSLCILLCLAAAFAVVAYVDEDELPGIIMGPPLPGYENIEAVALVGYGFQGDEVNGDGASILYLDQGGWWGPNEYTATVSYNAGTNMAFQIVLWDVAGNQWKLGSTQMTIGSKFTLDRVNDFTWLEFSGKTGCILDIVVQFPYSSDESYPSMLIEQRKVPVSTRDLLVLKPVGWEKIYAYADGSEELGEYPGKRLYQLGLLYHLPLENGAQKLVLSNPEGEVKTSAIQLKDNGKDVTVILDEDGSYQIFYDTLPDGIRKLTARIPYNRHSAIINEFEPGVLEEHTIAWLAERNGLFYTFIRDTTEEVQIACIGNGGAYWESDPIKLEPNGKDVSVDLSSYEAVVLNRENALSRKITVIPPSTWCSVEVCNEAFASYPGTALYQGDYGYVTDIPVYLTEIGLSGRLANGNRKSAGTIRLEDNGLNATITIAEDGSYTVLYGVMGDLTGDSKLNIGDAARLYAHLRGSTILTDSDVLLRADITGDGNLNMGDVAKLYSMIRNSRLV